MIEIGNIIDFKHGTCEVVYQTKSEVVLKRFDDKRLFIWSKPALNKWIKEDIKKRAKVKKEAEEKGANRVN